MRQLDAMYRRAMGMLARKPDLSKGKTISEHANDWGITRNVASERVKQFVSSGLMVVDTDYREIGASQTTRKTTVYRWNTAKFKKGSEHVSRRR